MRSVRRPRFPSGCGRSCGRPGSHQVRQALLTALYDDPPPIQTACASA